MWGRVAARLFCPPKIPPHSLETPLWNPLDFLGQCYMYLVIIAWYHLLIYLSTVDWMFTMCQSYFEVKGVKPWTEQRCAGYVKSLFRLPVITFSTPSIPFAIPVKIWVRTTPNINHPASPLPRSPWLDLKIVQSFLVLKRSKTSPCSFRAISL